MNVAFRRAGFLRYAAIQFVALVACAMAAYPGGTWLDPSTTRYRLAHNFLSDLGATRAFSGRSNYPSAALFAIAVVMLGSALVAFAWSWREFAFTRGRARAAGIASLACGTGSGAAFVAIALAPIDHALALHNGLVAAAFGLLAAYVASLALVIWRNRSGPLVPHLAYLALVVAYIALPLALGPGFATADELATMVIAQKIVVAGSIVHVVYLTTAIRRRLGTPVR